MPATATRRPTPTAGQLLAANVREAMSLRDMKPSALAARVGVPLRTVEGFIAGAESEGVVDLRVLQSVADALGVPVWLLFVSAPVTTRMGSLARSREN